MVRYMKSFEHDQLMYEEGRLAEIENTERENSLYVKMVSWSNTSGNAMVRRFIDKADTQTRDEIERLIAGDEILKEIHQELTYNELDSSIEVMLG